jgi:hypothetical protein
MLPNKSCSVKFLDPTTTVALAPLALDEAELAVDEVDAEGVEVEPQADVNNAKAEIPLTPSHLCLHLPISISPN